MVTRLSWNYRDSNEFHAEHNGFRIRAVIENGPRNPFQEFDCIWPVAVYHEAGFEDWENADHIRNGSVRNPLARFSDELLVHYQKHIENILPAWCDIQAELGARYSTNADELRRIFNEGMDTVEDDQLFATCAKLYALLDIPALAGTTCGHCQRDAAKVLVVATPEACVAFGCTEPPKPEELQPTIDLYGAWARGDVYGYVIERVTEDDDGEEIVEEIDSCWGYYGRDFDTSGLEDAAMDACPDEEIVDA